MSGRKKIEQIKAKASISRKRAEKRPPKAVVNSGNPAIAEKKATQNTNNKTQVKQPSDANAFPIVGIGASAGGLEAFTQLISALPADTGMGFVVIQHLDPTHESLTPEILSRTTQMPVLEIKDGMRVLPNHVYIMPSNVSVEIFQGVLSLHPHAEASGSQIGIDSFFQSLATDQRRRAVGIVLSGTASDGTQGLKAIKAEGGLVIVQDPKSAKFDGMPKSAIASGLVDLILPPEEIAHELGRISHHPYILATCEAKTIPQNSTRDSSDDSGDQEEIDAKPDAALRKIFKLLQTHMRVDFSNYKHTTLKRRLERRMMVRKTESIDAYVLYLNDHPDEIKALYADFLISVTEFFRDPDSFNALKEQVFPNLLKNRAADAAIRVWVPGCATGEEVYSLAILLVEFLGSEGAKTPIQIFATDISEHALTKARAGMYSESIERVVSKERLRLFFDKVGSGYKVNKKTRSLCLFSRHDVTRDPPFAKLDIVSCRNLLIYFAANLQKRVLPTFHYALKPGGFLWLGRSEGPGEFSKLFSLMDKTHKIYSKININTPMVFQFPANHNVPETKKISEKASARGQVDPDFQRDIDQIALSKFVPPGVVVNADFEILQFRGRTVPYLEPASGPASNHLFKMARHELLPGLRLVVQAAMKQNKPAIKEGLSFEIDGRRREVNIEVIPANPLAPMDQRNFVIFIQEVSSKPLPKQSKLSLGGKTGIKKGRNINLLHEQGQRNKQLEEELSAGRKYQRSMTAEFEVTKEELTSSNEELQSTNEELQSSNEEMETTKEELQSLNEELSTVNDELQNRNSELTVLGSDLSNLLSSVEIPILIVGNDLRIRRYTPQTEKVFKLIPSDIGRPIGDIRPNFEADLDSLVSNVIESLRPHEQEILDRTGKWVRLQIRPYKTIDNRIDGAVIVMTDIDALKQSLNASDIALKYAMSVADTVQRPFVVLDHELRLQSANISFFEYFKLSLKAVGSNFFDVIGIRSDQISKLHAALNEALTSSEDSKNFEVDFESPNIGPRKLLLSAKKIQWISSENDAILVALEDITERKQAAEILRASEARFRTLFNLGPVAIYSCDASGVIKEYNDHAAELWGRKPRLGDTDEKFCGSFKLYRQDGSFMPHEQTPMADVLSGKISGVRSGDVDIERPDGSRVSVSINIAPLKNERGEITGAINCFFDITERKRIESKLAEIVLREQEGRAEAEKGNRDKDLFLATLSHELRTPLTAILTWSQMLSMGKMDSEKSKRAVGIIEKSAKLQQQLISDLLDVSRAITGKLPLELQETDPTSAIQDALDAIRPLAEEKSIQLKTAFDPITSVVSADPIRLQQIFWNLLTNAIKFSEKGSAIEIRLETTKVESKDCIRFKVIDMGKGIPGHFLSHIFDRFSQADSTSTRVHGGLGLGLAIVRNLVDLHGGTVQAESDGLGKGATFTVTLPLAPSHQETQNISSKRREPLRQLGNGEDHPKLNGIRVLIVDDEDYARDAFAELLSSFGAETKSAASAREAFAIFSEFKPHVLMSDIAMPGEDGYSLMGKIRALGPKQGGEVPSLALTAYASGEDVERAYSAGFQLHLAKPVESIDLARAISDLAADGMRNGP
jgi:two-component system CheB/CheR fusion protein